MLMINVSYPKADEEIEIVRRTTVGGHPEVEAVLSPEKVIRLQEAVQDIPVSDHVIEYAVHLVRKTRPTESSAPDYVKEYVGWGAGRASQYLIMAGKARALLDGRLTVSRGCEGAAEPVLQHRVVTNFHADAEKISSRNIIERLVNEGN